MTQAGALEPILKVDKEDQLHKAVLWVLHITQY